MGPRAEDLEGPRIRDFPDPVLGVRELVHGLAHGVAHTGHHLHGVLQELARDMGVVPLLTELRVLRHEGIEDLLAARGELAALALDQGDLPLHTQGGTFGAVEINLHGVVLSWVHRDRRS